MAATDPQSLLNTAQCYNCFGPGAWPLIELALLAMIATNGTGGGGTGAFLSGSGSPVGAVTPTSVGQTYLDTTTPGFWAANGLTNNSWTQIA